jgi:LacI family transcriptional regulator
MAISSSGITLKEMAEHLGITPRAVSQALRNDGGGTTRVAPETVARVRALAEQRGYRLNTSARALRTRRFRQAGILVQYDFENMKPPLVETPAIFGLGDYLNKQGWHLIIVQDDGLRSGQGTPHYVREHSLDGLVLCSQGDKADDERAAELLDCGVPYIWYNKNAPTNAVGFQDVIGAELATQHMVELGHRRIVFVGSNATHGSLIEREQGYGNVMKAYGLEPVIWLFKGNWTLETDYQERLARRSARVREIIDDLMPHHQPTAIVCASDFEALIVNRALLTAGYAIPGDISVIGYNDLPLVDIVYPPLTTIRADFYGLGRMAGEMLLELLQQTSHIDLKSRFICPQLIIRNSTGPVPSSRHGKGKQKLP